jgi:RimJ/RimL family protein N-acetyltransferase
VTGPPDRIELPDAVLRPFTIDDADELARAVRASLEHLKPWMPWADANSASVDFQRQRLQGVVEQFARGEEYQYGLFDPDETRVLGSFGLMTRRGRGTLEIGYWVHVDAIGRGHATRATAALTDVALQQPRVGHVLIYTDVANLRSAAIPRKLGFELVRIEAAPKSASSETGQQQVWQRTTPISTAPKAADCADQ